MADLTFLYEENGLQGIVPYAFGMAGNGYKFLCKKLQEGVGFWVLADKDSGVPFISASAEKTYFSTYTTPEAAERRRDELAKDKFYTVAAYLEMGADADRLWRRYRDLGATHIRMDDSVWVRIKDLAPEAGYDGFLNQMAPIRNARLNAALYLLDQQVKTGLVSDELRAYFWKIFKDSHFYVPIRPVRPLKPGEAATPENTENHSLELENGHTATPVFTDSEFVAIYAEALELKPEEWSAAFTPHFENLKEYMSQTGNPIILNPYAGDVFLTLELFNEFEMISLNVSAARAAERAQTNPFT